MSLEATPSRKVPQTPAPATSKRGRNGEEPAALLRVRTGPKALRAVGGSSFKLWESKEKLTGRNTPPAVRKTKGLRNSRKEPPHPRWRKEAAGRAKGQTQPQRSHPLPHCKRPGFLSKCFPRPDRWRRLGPRREKARAAGERAPKPLAA